MTAKATIDLALPNSVQWRIRVTIATLCVAFYSLVSVVLNEERSMVYKSDHRCFALCVGFYSLVFVVKCFRMNVK
jgi:hypothetical protein